MINDTDHHREKEKAAGMDSGPTSHKKWLKLSLSQPNSQSNSRVTQDTSNGSSSDSNSVQTSSGVTQDSSNDSNSDSNSESNLQTSSRVTQDASNDSSSDSNSESKLQSVSQHSPGKTRAKEKKRNSPPRASRDIHGVSTSGSSSDDDVNSVQMRGKHVQLPSRKKAKRVSFPSAEADLDGTSRLVRRHSAPLRSACLYIN